MQYLVRALLCLCSAVAVVVSSQQLRDVPYVHFMGVNLTNHSYVDIFDISDDESTGHLECRTDLQTCCHSSDGDDRGSWFHPNGEVLPRAFLNPIGLYFFRRTQSINMRFRGTAVPSDSGIYQCTIETNAVNSADNTAREIVYVGIYESGGDVDIPQGIGFTEVTDPDGQTIQFTLTCISTGGPATTVTWTRDSEEITEGSVTELNDREIAQYTHTLTVAGKLEGVYTCTVSNNKPSSISRNLTVQAPDPPSNLQVLQTGPMSVLISWTVPPNSVATITGYTVYLTPQQGGTPVVNEVEAGETNSTVNGLTEAVTYSVTIVAESNTLRSNTTGPENITLETVTVTLSTTPLPTVIGDSVSITCLATLPDSLTGVPSFQWEGPGTALPVPSTSELESTLGISSIRTSQAGQYICTVSISFFTVSEAVDIIVQIPTPLPSIVVGRSSLLYAATSLTITCEYTLDELIDTLQAKTVSWAVGGSGVDTSQNRITVLGNNLTFNPLATSDSGSYTCTLSVVAQDYVTVQEAQRSSSPVTITVEELPYPEVSTTRDSQLNIGDQVTLECTVFMVPFLVTEPTLEWMNPVGDTLASSTTGVSLTHTVTVEGTSAAGVYVCQATVDVTDISLSVTGQSSTSITVQIPPPMVVINPSRTGILYAGTSLTFTCTVSLDHNVDTLPYVVITWAGPQSIPGEWNTVADTTTSGLTYFSSLSIAPLADDRDDGVYSCSVVVSDGNYTLESTASDSATIDVTNLPSPSIDISTSGLLLTGQSFTFECRASIVDNLIQLPSLELVAPNGTSLAEGSNTTILQHTLTSLAISDGGEYTCVMILDIPGSGINRQVSDTKSIAVVDAYPVEELTVISSSNSSLAFSWQPPTQGHNLSTGFKLMCTPLLSGIPRPQSHSNTTGADVTSLTLTGLYPGVPYNCSVVTLTSQGESESRSVTQMTEEIAPSGVPLSLQVVVGVNDITLSWSPPEVTLRNGMIIEYTLSYAPRDSAVMTLTTFTEPGTHTVDGFSASTDYNCSVVATNRAGTGPPARVSFTTQAVVVDSSANFDTVPVVAGIVLIVFIIAVMMIVLVIVVMIAKRRRQKYTLSRARPNSYMKRTTDAGSATVTANSNVEYAVINSKATNVVLVSEHEMIPIYKQLPPGKRPAPGYSDDGGVNVAVNTHVTSAFNGHPNGQTATYEKMRTYSNVGPETHLYAMPRMSKTSDEFPPEVIPDTLNYAVPHSRQNTVTRELPLSTADSTSVPYAVPHVSNKTMPQGFPPTSTVVGEDLHHLYNTPRSRQNTMTQQIPPSTTDGTPVQHAIPQNCNEIVTQEPPPEITDSNNPYNIPRSRQNTMTQQIPLSTADGTPAQHAIPQNCNEIVTQEPPPEITDSNNPYNVPRSRQNTMTQQLPHSAVNDTPAIPQTHNETLTQGSPSASTKDSQNLYNTPRSRQNTMTEQSASSSSVVRDKAGKKAHSTYDHLDKFSATQNPPHTAQQPPTQALAEVECRDHSTYATPRPASMTAKRPHSDLVVIDLGELGSIKPALAPSTDTTSDPSED